MAAIWAKPKDGATRPPTERFSRAPEFMHNLLKNAVEADGIIVEVGRGRVRARKQTTHHQRTTLVESLSEIPCWTTRRPKPCS